MSEHTTFDPDLGLRQDRRTLLKFLAGGAAVALAGCASKSATSGTTTTTATGATTGSTVNATAATTAGTTASTASSELTRIPQETAGPYPGDGSNGPDVLTESGVVRQDIRSSFGSSSTTVDGVPLSVELTIVDVATGTGKSGAAVYIWHCDAQGRYSMYSQGVTKENFLRGVQAADAGGKLSFTTVYPGCYQGRWPHIHFEVYDSLDAITSGNPVATSQLAMPDAANNAVFADSRYPSSSGNYRGMSLKTDNVFGDDGGVHETPLISGDATSGYTASLNVAV